MAVSLTAGAPSMSHSPAYYHNRANLVTAPFDEAAAPSSYVQPPPPAHRSQQYRNLSPLAASPVSQLSSDSGRLPQPAGAVSLRLSDVRRESPQSSPHSVSASFNAEQGSLNHGPNRSPKRYSGRYDTVRSQRPPRRDGTSAEFNTATYTYTPESNDVEKITDHAVLVLLWLACFDPFYSLFSALYSIVTVFALSILTPFRLCKPSSSFEATAIRALAPLFRLHLRLMYAESASNADELEFKAGRLIAVQVVSPVLSMGVAIAEWIAAPFWIFAIIMGNPDGTERRDDGRATVLAVRNWWEQCLLRAAVRRLE